MKTDIYGCFDQDTVIMYALPDDKDKFYYDSIKNVYEKYQGQTIEIYNEFIINPFGEVPEEDLPEGLCEGKWVEAEIKKGESIQLFNIYYVPITFSNNEFEDVIRVTPEHKFPVQSGNIVKDTEAYLLQTGDCLLFEDSQYDTNKIDKDISGRQKLLIRSIAKIEKSELKDPVNVYGIVFKEPQESPYILMPNGNIIHN